MKILLADIGTGTQDILLFDSRLDIENGLKMVVPSPTMIVRRRIQSATKRRQPVLLTGVTMGGGPSHWAVESHIEAGVPVYATPEAARSFNDDLEVIAEMGIQVISEDEVPRLGGEIQHLELKDFDFQALRAAFGEFGVVLDDLDLVAVAVFDHGAAPPGYSDRKFRFEYIERQLRTHNRLSAFAFHAEDLPVIMTRMKAVALSAGDLPAPLMLMDTAPAAVLGATLDPQVAARREVLIANVGNFHTLAFRLGGGGIEGVFEHHTGFMSAEKLDGLLTALGDGTLQDDDVFYDQGHGARVFSSGPMPDTSGGFGAVVVGPRRSLMEKSRLRPYFAAPYGDMMLVGCYGMLGAVPDLFPEYADEVRQALSKDHASAAAPWDVAR